MDSLTELGAAFQPAKQIPPNAICVSCIATVGLVALTTTWCHSNQQINTIIPNQYWQRYYLYCYLKTAAPQLKVLSTGGSTTLNLNTGRFSQLLIPQPPQSALEKFYKMVHPFFQGIFLKAQHVKRLTLSRNLLLTGLITGKIIQKNFCT
jgi:type I restriction enzyme S subunit